MCVAWMGSAFAVSQAWSGHQRSRAGGVTGSKLCLGRGTTMSTCLTLGLKQHPLYRLGPAVHRKVTQAPVNRHHQLTAHHLMGAHRLLRAQVPVGPGAVIGAHLEHRHVEGAQALADLLEAAAVGFKHSSGSRDDYRAALTVAAAILCRSSI